MNKRQISRICNFIGAALAIIFVIKIIFDYFGYSSVSDSAPYYIWIIADALYFIIPAILLVVIGIFVKKTEMDDKQC
ncbi:MAG: hypothetical protein IJT96_05540 [Lachnospiraceae bacterium]|nr:hypothetical protein [Lachnospiraceae bacterium]